MAESRPSTNSAPPWPLSRTPECHAPLRGWRRRSSLCQGLMTISGNAFALCHPCSRTLSHRGSGSLPKRDPTRAGPIAANLSQTLLQGGDLLRSWHFQAPPAPAWVQQQQLVLLGWANQALLPAGNQEHCLSGAHQSSLCQQQCSASLVCTPALASQRLRSRPAGADVSGSS